MACLERIIMISITLFLLASICNACMDTLKDHFDVSVFQKFDESFWNPAISWKKKTFLTYRFDGWHILKSLVIILICFSIVLYKPITDYWLLDIFIYGMAWNICFEVFWSKILKVS